MESTKNLDPIKLAEQIYEQRKQEIDTWCKELCSVIDNATEQEKKAINKDFNEKYQTAKKRILNRIFLQFSQLMKTDGAAVIQYATHSQELNQKLDYLTENCERSSSKMSHSQSYSEASPFDEDKALIMKVLQEKGHDVDHMTVWSDGTLLHNGKLYTQKDVVKICSRQNEIQTMKIDLITKTEFVLEQPQSGEKLIISPDDLSSQRYQIL